MTINNDLCGYIIDINMMLMLAAFFLLSQTFRMPSCQTTSMMLACQRANNYPSRKICLQIVTASVENDTVNIFS